MACVCFVAAAAAATNKSLGEGVRGRGGASRDGAMQH